MIGKTISRYQIIEQIGEGGMGVVYKAKDTRLNRTVAIKVPPPDALATDDDKRRFVQEAQAAAVLDHPSICTIYEIDEADGQTFISMAYCEGEDLRTKIERSPLKIETGLDIAIQIAEGLRAAHEKNIVHRDIKTANIMINNHGRAKILDFGLAKLMTSAQSTSEKLTMGTVAYMSPEQTKTADVDQRSDVWSLGVVMYEMVTGLLPFQGDYEQSIIYSIVNEDPQPISAIRSGVPGEFERIVTKCLARNVKNRYQAIDDLIHDLRELKAEIDSKEILSRSSFMSAAPRSRFRSMFVPSALLVVLVAVVVGIYIKSGQREAIGAQIPIAVTDFVNETGEPELDGLSEMLITSLEQSRLLSVLTRARMYDIIERIGNGPSDRIDEALGREICREANINVLVVASIRKFDDLYTIDLKAYDINSQDHLVTVREQGTNKSAIPGMIDRLAKKTRRGLNENTLAIAANSENVADITTQNLEAFQEYFIGDQHINKLEFDSARAAFERAIELDSTFALAHYRLVYANWWSNESEEIQRYQLDKALGLISRLPEKQRYLLRAQNAVNTDGYEKGIEVLREMENIYPDDKEMIYNIGDFSFHAKEHAQAARYLERVLADDPDDERALNHLTMTYIAMKEKSKALAIATRYADVTKSDEAYLALTNAHMIDGDTNGALAAATYARNALPESPLIQHQYATVQCMNDQFEVAKTILDSLVAGNQPDKILRMGYKSLVGANLYMGRYRDALDHMERGMILASYDPNRADSISAVFEHQQRGLIYLWGWNNADSADKEFRHAAEIMGQLGPDAFKAKLLKDYYSNLSIYYLMNNRLERADEIADKELAGDSDYYDRVRFFSHFKNDEYNEAQQIADTLLAKVEQGQKTLIRYYLAQGQMAHGQHDEAIVTLKKLQTEIHYAGPRPIFYAPSYFLLGQVYEGKGDTRLAIESYRKFLEFWKTADEDLLLLQQAKARLAGLETVSTQ